MSAPPPEQTGSTVGAIGAAAGRGLRWSLTGNLVLRMGSFAMGLVLARLLAPADFGVYAVALAVLNFVMHVNDVGIIAATVQWRGRLEEMAATGATLALGFSVAVYGVFWFTAPLLAEAAGSPQAVTAIRLLTVVILVDGVTAVRAGALVRRFEQDKLTKANLVGFAVNATVAIWLGFHGAGALSFVGGQVAGAVVTGVIVFVVARIPVEIGIDRAVLRRLMRFGIPLAASLGVEAVLLNADYIIVGRELGVTALGLYLLAFNLSSWLQGLVGTALRFVTVPSFSRLAEEEGALATGVQRSLPILVAVVLPVAVVMGVLAPDLIVVLYGDTWAPAAPVLRFLVVLMIVRLLVAFAFDVLTSAGATVRTLWLNIGWLVALIPALVVGTRLDGIEGTGIGHAVVAVAVAGPLAILLLRRAGVRLGPAVPALLRPVAAAAVATAVCIGVASVTGPVPVLRLIAGSLAALAVYVVIAVPHRQLRELAGQAATRARGITTRRKDVRCP